MIVAGMIWPISLSKWCEMMKQDVICAYTCIALTQCLSFYGFPCNKRIYHWRRTRFVLKTNTCGAGDELVKRCMDTNAFGAGDKPVSCWRRTLQCWRPTRWKCVFDLQLHTHSSSYPQLSKLFTSENRYNHTVEIQKVSRCTLVFSITINWLSRPIN